MKIESPAVLETIFSLKRNFARGPAAPERVFSGVEIAPFKDNARAAVCISGDFEMSWAWRGRDARATAHRASTERANVPFILDLLERYSIPVTWATVGHLFLESCQRSGAGVAHDDMPRPKFNDRWDGDWYAHDPCSNGDADPLWYAPDLVRRILECGAPQEIGTHTFSHINFSAERSTPALVRAEIEACIHAMAPFGVQPRSLVFPHNIAEYSYLPLLAELGITSVRHRDESVRLAYPERTASGVYRIYESMNLRASRRYDYVAKARIFLKKAMERQAVYALWFHPSDSLEVFDTQFRGILRYIDAERRDGKLWVTTMRDLAAYCYEREQLGLQVTRNENMITVHLQRSTHLSPGGAEITLATNVESPPRMVEVEAADGSRNEIAVRLHPSEKGRQVSVTAPASSRSVRLIF
ncbi:MAG TPA: polysaccharide deacetylase family protein [Terriglobia bacterium]|nr:polysaccharide deacetylase family protein [Terriglobia bacterium]